MGLVDYSSGGSVPSSSDAESVHSQTDGPPPAKKRKAAVGIESATAGHDGAGSSQSGGPSTNGVTKGKEPATDLPPLPDSFHDLYASTVRNSVADDPSLHQGRKRATPHVPGNWPSHIYVEWHPSTKEHALLVNLVNDIQKQLGSDHVLESFLTSDLNAALPLHISLSRPLMLKTATKDPFLSSMTSSLRAFKPSTPAPRSSPAVSQGASFKLSPGGLAFYRSPDSDRTFLVLRVAHAVLQGGISSNPQLRELLRRSNTVAASYGLPTLYARAIDDDAIQLVDNAFHISIAWTFRLPDEDKCLRSYRIFRADRFKELRRCKIPVMGVKVKIGNVVTNVPLIEGRAGSSPTSTRGYRSSKTPASSSAEGDESPWA